MTNQKTARFEEMENVHNDYFPLFKSLCKENKYPTPIKTMIDDFVIGRIGSQKGVRAFIFQQLYSLAGGKADIKWLLVAIELQLAAMYCFNVAADEKAGYESPSEKLIAYETQNIAVSLSDIAIRRWSDNNKLTDKLLPIFHQTYLGFQKGEVLDTLVNLYKNIGKYSPELIKEYDSISEADIWTRFGIPKKIVIGTISDLPNKPIENFTLERTYGINAAMIENFGKIIQVILSLDNKKTSKLMQYGKYYGLGMMIINDVQDYSLDLIEDKKQTATREKNKSDVFSDIRKGKITWPIMYALEINPELNNLFNDKIGNEHIPVEECGIIRLELMNNGALKKCVLEASYYGKLANNSLVIFPDNEHRSMLYETSTSMMRLSKYIYALEKKFETRLRPTGAEIKKRISNSV